MIHTLIVPGVGGSNIDHWQSWLERQLKSTSRVQQDWNHPVLSMWVANMAEALLQAPEAIQIVAHSFGCLTSLATLEQYPELCSKVKKLILVAPANPARFSSTGFAQTENASSPEGTKENYRDYFLALKPKVPTEMIISENDPWLSFEVAQQLSQIWQVPCRNLGQVGHINVASGFGYFPEIFDHLLHSKHQGLAMNAEDWIHRVKLSF
ncbi:RBBP9/YdeN family alpha/beta hydrolase [Acinetobacter rudis]|uniref:Alpha/beta hydrolase n=1 Tax=Acinetobacter rudis TaxID=632955 RepID=A0AAW8J6I6_9GAMM|nr:alpha/beta hydrolase [Acinetobacter rudis]MDQ8935682.1 alpha/beta hydrolase [Acinetobacter rudis]MDQ9017945.1 alpha/beta hydrolase [Acinetobacter rudis]